MLFVVALDDRADCGSAGIIDFVAVSALLLWCEHWRGDERPGISFFSRLRPSPRWLARTLAIGGLPRVFSLVIQLATRNLSHHHHMIDRPTRWSSSAVAIIGTWAVIGCRALAENSRGPAGIRCCIWEQAWRWRRRRRGWVLPADRNRPERLGNLRARLTISARTAVWQIMGNRTG
jgi:hypothetical protein